MKKVFFLFVLVLISIAGFFILHRNPHLSSQSLSEQTAVLSATDAVSSHVIQTIRTPGKATVIEKIPYTAEQSALAILRDSHAITTKTYSFGEVVESIDGVNGGQDSRYWIFYVNGKQSAVGAGEYIVKEGDSIIWNFQKENENL